jgi:hypothetical protein
MVVHSLNIAVEAGVYAITEELTLASALPQGHGLTLRAPNEPRLHRRAEFPDFGQHQREPTSIPLRSD